MFGPLALRSTLGIERKHKSSTDWAKVMCCFKNPAFSFLDRHQSILVLNIAKYSKTDFFLVDNSEPALLENKPDGAKKVKLSSTCIPHHLKKGVLRKFEIKNTEYWIHSIAFWQQGEELLCEGLIYSSSLVQTHALGITLELFSPRPMFIFSKYLSHVNHFLYTIGGETIVINGLL